MSDRYDRDILEQMSLINEDAKNIHISEQIKPENMMKRIEEMEKKGYLEGTSGVINMVDIMDKKQDGTRKKKRRKRMAMFTGAGATIVAATLTVVMLVHQIGINKPASSDVTSVYADNMRREISDGVYVLSGYKELNDYIVAMETMRQNDQTEDMKGFGDDIALNGSMEIAPEIEYSGTDSEIDEDNPGDSSAGASGENSDYSDTNVRTEGVAEADIVKTDGRYIYHLGHDYDEKSVNLVITSAEGADSEKIAKVSILDDIKEKAVEGEMGKFLKNEPSTKLEIYGAELIVSGDKLVVVVQPHISGENIDEYAEYITSYPDSMVVAMIYDISDKSAPELVSTLTLEGAYDSCRMVNGYVYIFTDMANYDTSSIYDNDGCTEEEAAKNYAPKVCGKLLPAEDVYITDCESFNQYHIIATIDMNDVSKFNDVKAILGESGFVNKYVSEGNIYIITDMQNEYRNALNDTSPENGTIKVQEQSQILRLSYADGNITPNGSVIIDGSVGDEFDIDEYNGYLRMAVSTYYNEITYNRTEVEYYDGIEWLTGMDWVYNENWTSWGEGSALYVYDENLELVGSISQLKENEQVYGVRFDGDIAYVVTYEQTDPLFTIDLSDPKNPTVMGALKIPGFSTYLHKWDDNKLIGLGYDEYEYIKISTFDITDKYDVKETDVYSLEEVYWTEALSNHKAIFVSPDKNLIGFAVEDYCLNKDKTRYDYCTVYKIFSYVEGKPTEIISCQLDGLTYETRGMYIGEYIYIVNENDGVIVYNMTDYSQVAHVK